ncbi:MAG: SMI1/KNR4 family protein [Chloroflexi bacterium]|nr:SMI1/KNR4 family protein [Chloroflexota bacterium]
MTAMTAEELIAELERLRRAGDHAAMQALSDQVNPALGRQMTVKQYERIQLLRSWAATAFLTANDSEPDSLPETAHFEALTERMSLESFASEADLRDLRDSAAVDLPEDYLAFLRWSNGAEGEIGPNYVQIWSADQIYRDPYPYGDELPGILFFAGDGGEAAFGFDTRIQPMPVVVTHYDDLDADTLVPIAPTFTAFLEFLASNDWTDYWFSYRSSSPER